MIGFIYVRLFCSAILVYFGALRVTMHVHGYLSELCQYYEETDLCEWMHINTHTYACIHAYIHIYKQVSIIVYTSPWEEAWMYAYTHMNTLVSVTALTHVCMCACMYVPAEDILDLCHIYIYTYTHTYMGTRHSLEDLDLCHIYTYIHRYPSQPWHTAEDILDLFHIYIYTYTQYIHGYPSQPWHNAWTYAIYTYTYTHTYMCIRHSLDTMTISIWTSEIETYTYNTHTHTYIHIQASVTALTQRREQAWTPCLRPQLQDHRYAHVHQCIHTKYTCISTLRLILYRHIHNYARKIVHVYLCLWIYRMCVYIYMYVCMCT
jgi:hypothetical protein